MNRLLKMFPKMKWDFYQLSMNEHFTMKILVENHDKNLAWGYISRWMPLTIKFVKDHPEYRWDYALLSANPSITIDDILENPDIPWRFDFFSGNVNLPLWYVRENLDKGWNWYFMSTNSGITMDDINENMDLPWHWLGVSYNINITIEFLDNHLDLPILWNEAVSKHMKIDVDILSRHADKGWDYRKVLRNPHMTIDILRYLASIGVMNDRYIWGVPTVNPAFSIQDIEDNADLPWKMNLISSNPNFSLEHVNKYLSVGKSISLNNIVKNVNAKIDDVYELIIENIDGMISKLMKHFPVRFGVGSRNLNYFLSQKRNIWENISANPNITIAFVKKHCVFINFKVLSTNQFKLFEKIGDRLRYLYVLNHVNDIPKDIAISLITRFL